METVTIDEDNCVVIPNAKPGQVYTFEQVKEGWYKLTILRAADVNDPFPPGCQKMIKAAERFNREWAGVKLVVPEIPEDRE